MEAKKYNIKVVKILTTHPDYQPSGKNYVIRSWDILAERDGKTANIKLKTMCKQELKQFDTIPIEESIYNNQPSYLWKPEKKDNPFFGKSNQKKWTWSQYANLINHVRLVAKSPEEFEKILGCASVLLDPDRLEE